jgi:hypothetical protein
MNAKLKQTAARLWSASPLENAVFNYLKSKDCSLNSGLSREQPQFIEDLTLGPHEIHTTQGDLATPYIEYLRQPAGKIDQRKVGVVELTNARLAVPTGVASGEQGIVMDAFPNHSVLRNPKYAMPQLALPRRKPSIHIPEAIQLQGAWAHNFFHWTIDYLPRLQLLEALPTNVPLIAFKDSPRFVRESFDMLAPKREVLWLDKGVYSFDNLYVPSNLASPALVAPHAVAFLTETYGPAILRHRQLKKTRRNLYISRRDAASRQIANETALIEALEPLGFQSVTLSDYSISDQAALFADADLIVGSHGAGFVNLAFSQPGTGLVEIFRDGFRSRSFYSLAEQRNAPYGLIIGQPQGNDTYVDVESLLALIHKLT